MSFIDYFKAAWDVAKKAQNVEIESALLEMREEYNTSREEILNLKGRISELLEELRQSKGGVFFRKPWYYTKSTEGIEDGPFCPTCHDTKNGQLVRGHDVGNEFEGWGIKCVVCKFYEHKRAATRDINAELRTGRNWSTDY